MDLTQLTKRTHISFTSRLHVKRERDGRLSLIGTVHVENVTVISIILFLEITGGDRCLHDLTLMPFFFVRFKICEKPCKIDWLRFLGRNFNFPKLCLTTWKINEKSPENTCKTLLKIKDIRILAALKLKLSWTVVLSIHSREIELAAYRCRYHFGYLYYSKDI